MPANSLHIGLGNLLDDRFSQLATNGVTKRSIDGNRTGSLSNLAAYLEEQMKPPSLAMMFWCGIVGKLFGEIVSSHLMVLSYGQAFLGLSDIFHSAELNAPVYLGFAGGAMVAFPLQHIANRARAHNANLKLTLSQYDQCEESIDKNSSFQPRPDFDKIKDLKDAYFGNRYSNMSVPAALNKAIAKRDVIAIAVLLRDQNALREKGHLTQSQLKRLSKLHYFPSDIQIEGKSVRQTIYDLIFEQAEKPSVIEKLINEQLQQGAPGVDEVKKLLNTQLNLLQNSKEEKITLLASPRYCACLTAAIKIGDVALIKQLAALKGDVKTPIFIPMLTRKGETLLHLAYLSQNKDTVDEVILMLNDELKKGPVTYKVNPSYQQVLSMPSVREFNLSFSAMLAKTTGEKTVSNVFELQGGNGRNFIDSDCLTYAFANIIDEANGMRPDDPKSLSTQKLLSERTKFNQSMIEYFLLFPFKMGVGVPVSNLVSQVVGLAIGSATAPFGGVAAAPTIAGLVSFAIAATLGTVVFITMLISCAALLASGTKSCRAVENWLHGFESRFTGLGIDAHEIENSLTAIKGTPKEQLQKDATLWWSNYQAAVEEGLNSLDPSIIDQSQIRQAIKTINEDKTIDPGVAYLRIEKLIASLNLSNTQNKIYVFAFADKFTELNLPEEEHSKTAPMGLKSTGEVIQVTELQTLPGCV
jgi:hypothetical protein